MERPEDLRSNIEINLIKLFDECMPTDPLAPYQARIREWATTYLAAPHPELGREGAVCPFTPTSIRKEAFWVGCADFPDITELDIEKTTVNMVTRFLQLPPTAEPDTLFKTILILFPAVTDYSLIGQVQRRLKDKFVSQGLMIGQFYPGCEEPGIWNSRFKPMQSPFALLAIRHMVSNDFPFLIEKADWVADYLKRFAPDIPASIRSMIVARFDTQGRSDTSEPRLYVE